MRHSELRPDGLVRWHPFGHVGQDEAHLRRYIRRVGHNLINIVPAGSAVPQTPFDVLERQSDFAFEIRGHHRVKLEVLRCTIPAAWTRVSAICLSVKEGQGCTNPTLARTQDYVANLYGLLVPRVLGGVLSPAGVGVVL